MSCVHVVVNPAAGGGRAGPLWTRLEPLARSLAAIQVETADGRDGSIRAIQGALSAGCERIVVVGGDGTIHLAVNELMVSGTAADVGLGIVPAGTGSDLARALRLPRHPEEALRRAVAGRLCELDVGRCDLHETTFFFANIASAGIGGMVDSMVNAMPRRGRTAFLRATLKALTRYRPIELAIALDGEAWYEGPVFLVAVANGTSFGKGMKAAPDASMEDGLFDVVLVGPVRGLELVLRLPQVYLGRHLRARPVSVRRASTVRLTPKGAMPPFDADGETYPAGPAELTVLPGALRVAAAGGGIDA